MGPFRQRMVLIWRRVEKRKIGQSLGRRWWGGNQGERKARRDPKKSEPHDRLCRNAEHDKRRWGLDKISKTQDLKRRVCGLGKRGQVEEKAGVWDVHRLGIILKGVWRKRTHVVAPVVTWDDT